MGLQGQIKNLKQLQILWVILGLSCGIAVVGAPTVPAGLGRGSLGRGEESRGGLLAPSTRGTSAFDQCGEQSRAINCL